MSAVRYSLERHCRRVPAPRPQQSPMKITDPAIASLATAKSLLLDPWGLTEADMARALGESFTH
ncbi:hypothetical protein FGX01_00775, partial [Xylella fastidiosa subsp. multiplex]|nr:hypothetical protein [Xylella fastidiosa subsp. multiplex]